MNKASKLIKRYVALILVLLFSIESFAAVVGDNDGAAFITKAEFDSLKNDFQSQLDRYNSSIDNKIDGAIASYLSGISIAKETIINAVVSNYDEMKWMREWNIYGWYRRFHNSSMTEDKSDEWYRPHIQDFYAMRRTNYQITMSKIRDSGGTMTTVWGDWDYTSGRWCARDQSTFIPHFALSCDASKDDEIVLCDLPDWAVGLNTSYNFSSNKIIVTRANSVGRSYAQQEVEDYGEYWNASASAWTSTFAAASPDLHSMSISPILATETRTPWITDLGATGDDILYWRIACNRSNVRSNIYSNVFHLTPQHTSPLQIWNCYGLDKLSKADYTDAHMTSGNTYFSNHFWDEDLYIDGLDSATTDDQVDDLRHLMLGKDFNWTTSLLRIDDNKPISGYNYVATKYSTFTTLKLGVNAVAMGSTNMWTADNISTVTHTPAVSMNWRVPSMEHYDFKKITSGLFKNDTVNIKFGQGLPITKSLVNNGTLNIEFDYSIGRTVGTVPSTATGIEIDLKDTDFLITPNTYYTGYLNDSTSAVSIHNLEVDNITKHVKLKIEDVKKDNGVWLRIAPKSTEAGLYAQMDNLKVNLISE